MTGDMVMRILATTGVVFWSGILTCLCLAAVHFVIKKIIKKL